MLDDAGMRLGTPNDHVRGLGNAVHYLPREAAHPPAHRENTPETASEDALA
jgi:hypothetical protein